MRGRNGECSAELQRAAALFNPQLAQIINSLNEEIGSHVFIAVNTQMMHMDFVSNPQAYGILFLSLSFLLCSLKLPRPSFPSLYNELQFC